MGYPGGKNGSGVYQQIINLMPPHQVYIEPFLGGGAVLRMKRPACSSIGIDINLEVISDHGISDGMVPELTLLWEDALYWLASHTGFVDAAGVMVYLDPPYLMETRSYQGKLYDYEFTVEQHLVLLDLILSWRNCNVMISGYYSDLYASKLAGWTTKSFQARTHTYTATEWLWFNYQTPVELHDYSFLGEGYRERERIKKKKARWVARLGRMDVLERQALLSVLAPGAPEMMGSAVAMPYLVVPPGKVVAPGSDEGKKEGEICQRK